jgi:hypothetical protein
MEGHRPRGAQAENRHLIALQRERHPRQDLNPAIEAVRPRRGATVNPSEAMAASSGKRTVILDSARAAV